MAIYLSYHSRPENISVLVEYSKNKHNYPPPPRRSHMLIEPNMVDYPMLHKEDEKIYVNVNTIENVKVDENIELKEVPCFNVVSLGDDPPDITDKKKRESITDFLVKLDQFTNCQKDSEPDQPPENLICKIKHLTPSGDQDNGLYDIQSYAALLLNNELNIRGFYPNSIDYRNTLGYLEENKQSDYSEDPTND